MLRRAYKLCGGYALHLEARATKPIIVIAAIYAAVVILPKEACALRRVGDGVILEGCGATAIFGYKHYAPATCSHDAVQLPECQSVILDMLQEVVAYHHIYRTRLEGYMLHIEVHICEWRL